LQSAAAVRKSLHGSRFAVVSAFVRSKETYFLTFRLLESLNWQQNGGVDLTNRCFDVIFAPLALRLMP